MTQDEAIGNAAPYLAKCGRVAEENGVKILIETHDSFCTGAMVAKLIRSINSKGVAVLWDIHHPFRAGEPVEETYRQIGASLRHVHMKDEVGGKLCLTGKGTLPLKEIVALLGQKGYSGYLSLEWEKMWVKELEGPEIALPQYIEFMRSIM
jgi:sugar phosphate isomerase/epimerase